jgi:hypothetical protein
MNNEGVTNKTALTSMARACSAAIYTVVKPLFFRKCLSGRAFSTENIIYSNFCDGK